MSNVSRAAGLACLSLLRAVHGLRPVRLEVLRRLNQILPPGDLLLPPPQARDRDPAACEDAFLREALKGRELGGWSLDAPTINFLDAAIERDRPGSILEFGSGISTLCLAHFASRGASEGAAPRIYSIDQDAAFMDESQRLLETWDLDGAVTFLHAPLTSRTIADRQISSYDLDESTVRSLLGGDQPEIVLIDGPAAEEGARVSTLPLVRSLVAPGARVLLDDALRDGEIRAATAWERQGLATVEGVVLIGSGLMVGRIRP